MHGGICQKPCEFPKYLLLFPYQTVNVNEKLHQGKKRGRNTEYSDSKNPNKPRFWLGAKVIYNG